MHFDLNNKNYSRFPPSTNSRSRNETVVRSDKRTWPINWVLTKISFKQMDPYFIFIFVQWNYETCNDILKSLQIRIMNATWYGTTHIGRTHFINCINVAAWTFCFL